MGFEPQIARILGNIRPDRQTVMFSATFPRKIENLAKKILNRPIEIVVGQRGQSCASVDQRVEVLDENHKFIRLLQILTEYSDIYYESEEKYIGIIIFVDQKSEADELFKELFKRGYSACLIHGGQDQEDRNFAIHEFKTGVKNILISTSVCARGLDVKHCGLVINFKCPNHMEDYVHRVGKNYLNNFILRSNRKSRKKRSRLYFYFKRRGAFSRGYFKGIRNFRARNSRRINRLSKILQRKVRFRRSK
jgi:ATP-dependent RNA helicase DDX46/PRP5